MSVKCELFNHIEPSIKPPYVPFQKGTLEGTLKHFTTQLHLLNKLKLYLTKVFAYFTE